MVAPERVNSANRIGEGTWRSVVRSAKLRAPVTMIPLEPTQAGVVLRPFQIPSSMAAMATP